MAPKTLSLHDETSPSSRANAVSELTRRSQSQKAVSSGTINTVIAITVILGVIFIAFALTVIYWRYMAKIDREERENHARMELSRRAKKLEPPNPDSERRQRIAGQLRPRGGNGRSRGKYQQIGGRGFWLIGRSLQAHPKATRRLGCRSRSRAHHRPGLRR